MKNLTTIILLLFATVAWGLDFKMPNNNAVLGRTNNGDKSFTFLMGLGGSDPSITAASGTGVFIANKDFNVTGDLSATGDLSGVGLTATGNTHTFGDGVDSVKQFIFDIGLGGSNPYIGWDTTSGALVFNNGASEKKIGAGTGGGDGGVNLLVNPSFEDSGSPILNWTNSGGTLTQEDFTNGTENDEKYLRFVATGAGQYFESDPVTVPDDFTFGMMIDARYQTASTVSGLWDMVAIDVGTGLPVASSTLSAHAAWEKAPTNTFPTLTAGSSVKFRIVSTGADTIEVNSAYLGSNKNIAPSANGRELVFEAYYPSATNCEWTNTTVGSFTDFSVDSDCVAPVARLEKGMTLDTTDNDRAQFGVIGMPAGRYEIVVLGANSQNNNNPHAIALYEDTTATLMDKDQYKIDQMTVGADGQFRITTEFTNPSNATRLFKLRGQVFGGVTLTMANNPFQNGRELQIKIFKINGEVEDRFTPDTQSSGLVEASIGGANINLMSGGPVSVEASALSMTVDRGSLKIPCEGSNVSEGLNCNGAGVNEVVGGVVNLKSTGVWVWCGAWRAGIANTASTFWRMTNDGSETSIQDGKRTTGGTSESSTSTTNGESNCAFFDITEPGVKAFRLFSEGNTTETYIRADGSFGREIRVWGYWFNKKVANPYVMNQVRTSRVNGARIEACRIDNNGTATTNGSLCGTWIDSVSRISLGKVTVNIKAGTFSEAPVCTCLAFEDSRFCGFNSVHSTTSQLTFSHRNSSGANEDQSIYIQCQGAY